MKDKNNNYQPTTITVHGPTTITAHDNSVLDLPDEIPGLFVLSKYNTQYQQKQKNRFGRS